jgi:hypothetical protein
MAETADDELPPPANAYTPSDDDLNALVGEATEDLVTEAPDAQPEPTPARSRAESRAEEGAEQISEGQVAEGEHEEEGEEPPEGTATEPEPAAQAAREAPKGKPFKFKASGAEHTFQGVEELEDGTLRVSKEATPQFRGVLASYVELQRTSKEERRNLQRQLNAAQTRKSDKDHEADAITKLFKDIQAMSPEERWAWAENFTDNAKNLELEIKQQAIDRKEKELEAKQNGQQDLLPEEAEEQLQNTLQQEVYSTFTRLLALPEAKALPNEDRKALYEKWQKRALKLAVRATQDMPEIGVKKGQLYFDDSDIVDDFNDRLALLKRAKGTVTAAQRNAKMNADQGRGRTPPPVVRGGRPPAGKGTEKKDLGRDRKGFKKKFLAGELDAKD